MFISKSEREKIRKEYRDNKKKEFNNLKSHIRAISALTYNKKRKPKYRIAELRIQKHWNDLTFYSVFFEDGFSVEIARNENLFFQKEVFAIFTEINYDRIVDYGKFATEAIKRNIYHAFNLLDWRLAIKRIPETTSKALILKTKVKNIKFIQGDYYGKMS